MKLLKVRQDAWTKENDLLLAETVLRHVREGSTQLNAFEEVGDKLNRTSAACGFRWNAVVRRQYEKALDLAKKQRKQRQRLLGKEQGGKKKLLYKPPTVTIEDIEATEQLLDNAAQLNVMGEVETEGTINLDKVISYLQNLNNSNLQVDIYKSESARLRRENNELKKQNDELQAKINKLEDNSETMQEDYETLIQIMNRARKLVLFDDEDQQPSTTFKMDRNGNLEKLAE